MTPTGATPREGAVSLRGIAVTHTTNAGPVKALRGVDLTLPPASATAVVGRSGSGKSTLVSVLTLLRRPTAGEVWIDGAEVGAAADRERTRLRAARIGVVFQAFHLEPSLTVLDNVLLPWAVSGVGGSRRDALTRAAALFERLDITELRSRRPPQLSGGQRQRVAVARALLSRPALLVADEPTGNLDEDSAGQVASLILGAAAEDRSAVVLVTHDETIARQADRTLMLVRGQVVDDVPDGSGLVS